MKKNNISLESNNKLVKGKTTTFHGHTFQKKEIHFKIKLADIGCKEKRLYWASAALLLAQIFQFSVFDNSKNSFGSIRWKILSFTKEDSKTLKK